jgi:two-component system, NarL family, nitrate/nitrite response regulator NarL
MLLTKGIRLTADKDNETIADGHVARILLVEDHTSFRQALAFVLEAEPEFVVAAQVGTIAGAREALADSSGVDIAIVDLGLPDGDGVDLIRELSDVGITSLVLSASPDPIWFAKAVEASAAGVLDKVAALSEIVGAVRRLQAGESLLSPEDTIRMLRAASTKRYKEHEAMLRLEKLTPRERQVLKALAEGLDSKEIAQKLGITIETERTHIINILSKLGVNSRLQALVFAARHGLVEFH